MASGHTPGPGTRSLTLVSCAGQQRRGAAFRHGEYQMWKEKASCEITAVCILVLHFLFMFIKAVKTKSCKAAGVSFPLHSLKVHRDLLSFKS